MGTLAVAVDVMIVDVDDDDDEDEDAIVLLNCSFSFTIPLDNCDAVVIGEAVGGGAEGTGEVEGIVENTVVGADEEESEGDFIDAILIAVGAGEIVVTC